MTQTKKGHQWYFDMKIHVGTDVKPGAVHGVTVTAANTNDIEVLPKLLRDEDRVILGDAGHASDDYKKWRATFGLALVRQQQAQAR